MFDQDFLDFISAEIEQDKAEAKAYKASAMGRLEASIESAKAAFWESRRGPQSPEQWKQAMRLDSNIIPF